MRFIPIDIKFTVIATAVMAATIAPVFLFI
jgi:hypothetical protein